MKIKDGYIKVEFFDGFVVTPIGEESVKNKIMLTLNGTASEIWHLLKDDDPCLERTKSGFVIRRKQREDVVFEGKIDDLKILHDGYMIEVFVNGGTDVFSAVLC